MAAVGLAEIEPELDQGKVRRGLEGNLCRCTGYLHIEQAVLKGARTMRENGQH